MDPFDFQELAADMGAVISAESAGRLLRYLDAMLDENTRVNLTAVRDPEKAVMFHALDAVALALCTFDEAPKMALDIGTGNGFPGVAIACLFPNAKVVLMDRTLKKLKAIERALDAAGFELGQFELLQMDAAEAPGRGYKSKFDLITTRAVGSPRDMGRLADPLLMRGGRFVAWLSDETVAIQTLKGKLRKVNEFEYSLPAPANRFRRLAEYRY